MKKSGICLGAFFCCLVFTLAPAFPEPTPAPEIPHLMPLNPDVIEQAKARGEEIDPSRTEARFVSKDGRRINAPAERRSLKSQEVRAIVLLVDFTDNPPGGPTTRYSEAVFDSMLFGQTYIRGGLDTTTDRTLKNYYDEISYGNVDVVTLNMTGSTGWVTAPNNYTYYCEPDGTHDNGFGPYPRNVQRLVMDAVLAADPYVDFSQYATGGEVENLFIVHAGSGAEWNGGPTLIWSHAWNIDTSGVPNLFVDGVQITNYSMEPECGGDTTGEGGTVSGPYLPTVGVFAHEFGHVIGLPDEYDYGYESSGTGRFSLMAGGSWNRTPNEGECAGNSPAHPSAWGKVYLGFVTPVEVTGCLLGASIPPAETTNVDAIYKLTNPASAGQEYWLVENRQQIGFDEGFIRMTADAHGIVIYHVDENVMDRTFWRPNEAECVSGEVYQGTDNCDCDNFPASDNGEKWYGISIEQADGLYQLELGTSSGYWQDFYNSITGASAFTTNTTPNNKSYYGCATSVYVENISGSTGTMTADFYGPAVCQTLPAGLDFGLVDVGSYLEDTFAITNTGDGILSGNVSETCDHYSITEGGGAYSLGAGQSQMVTIRFEPTTAGEHVCSVETGSACCGSVACSGTGVDSIICPPDSVMFVDADATGLGNGSSWQDAYPDLSGALSLAQACSNVTQIWVAEGTYTPTGDTERAATFQLQDNLAVFGGFSGDETYLSERDWSANMTILSGDIGVPDDNSDNSFHVVTASNNDSTAVLDGFTITLGQADGGGLNDSGGGLFIGSGGPTLIHLTISGNISSGHGGGLFTKDGNPTIANVVVSGNSGDKGGGIHSENSSLTLTNVTISGNSANEQGGGMYTKGGNATLTNAIFWDNSAIVSSPEIYQNNHPVISFSLIGGCGGSGTGWDPEIGTDGGNNIDAPPLFLGAPTNLRLGAGSPAINAGDNTAIPAGISTDLDGNPRIIVGVVDMGAFERDYVSAVDDISEIPDGFALLHAVPNPFNPMTTIKFELPKASKVKLIIFDVSGRKVRTLLKGEVLHAGRHESIWQGRDDDGRIVATGVYFYRLLAGSFSETKRMTLVK